MIRHPGRNLRVISQRMIVLSLELKIEILDKEPSNITYIMLIAYWQTIFCLREILGLATKDAL